MKNSTKKPELLAPAGSLESFFAAMEKGADAVYAGLRDFSARARSKNFTLYQMERMLAYAHEKGKKVYVTLNTLIKEDELPQLVEILSSLASMRADGIIIQDMAVARLARNHFPSIPLHASTQMTIHNSPGVRMLHELGFQRVVLARELSFEEIAAITASTPAEIEVFVHGALCFSISGQCFFSSYLGGHSGNRGRCAQPCRRLYTHRGKQGHYFSTSDLSAIEMVPALEDAGVKSLKIEGRMKSAEYVATVVEAYRLLLDSPEKSGKEALIAAKELLKYSFGRTPTKGFMASRQPDDIANPWQKGGTGRFIGRVKGVRGNRIIFETRDSLHVGDRLRVQPKTDMAGQAWTLRELFCNRKKVMEAGKGSIVEVESPFNFKAEDSVYKVSSREAFTLSENACIRKLESAGREKLPCRLSFAATAVLRHDEESSSENDSYDCHLHIRSEVSGIPGEFSFLAEKLHPASNSGMKKALEKEFAKTGETPFRLLSIDASELPELFFPPQQIKEMRREFYRQLKDSVYSTSDKIHTEARRNALRDIESHGKSGYPDIRTKRETLTVATDDPLQSRFLLQSGADFVLLPLTKGVIHQIPLLLPRLRELEGRVIFQLPFMIFEHDIPFYADTLKQLYRSGFRRFEVSNICHFELLRDFGDIHISTWYRCFSTNSQALRCWEELGAEAATLYLEDDSANIASLLSSGLKIERRVVAYARLPLMTTRISMKDVRNNIPLTSDRGEEYSVTSRDGLNTISAGKPFSLTQHHQELRERGCASFLIDLRQCDRSRWPEVLGAFKAGRSIPGSSGFNYLAGLI